MAKKKDEYNYCVCCGKEVFSKTKPKKYCSKCAKIVNIEKTNSKKKK